jgi:hypothetical protein
MTTADKSTYRPAKSKYEGGASEMFITYDLDQPIRGVGHALVPKVKKVYIAGNVEGWKVGDFRKRTGHEVHGVRIVYRQSRRQYRREGYRGTREPTQYYVPPIGVPAAQQRFARVVELPPGACNVELHGGAEELPERYRRAIQKIR